MNSKSMVAIIAIVVLIAAGGAFVLMNNSDDGKQSYSDGDVVINTPTDYKGSSTTQTFTEIPDRVVIGCNTALNLFLYLGLEDRIVGCYYMEEEPWAEVADEYAALKERIGEDHILSGNITQATLTDWEPDCVIG